MIRGDVAEWLGRGLQNLVQRFESARRLQFQFFPCLGGGTGRRKGLKIPRWKHRAGSIPALGTKNTAVNFETVCSIVSGLFRAFKPLQTPSTDLTE